MTTPSDAGVTPSSIQNIIQWMNLADYNCQGTMKKDMGNGVLISTMKDPDQVLQWEKDQSAKNIIDFKGQDVMLTNFNGCYVMNNRDSSNIRSGKVVAKNPSQLTKFVEAVAKLLQNGYIWPLSNYSYSDICADNPPYYLARFEKGQLINVLQNNTRNGTPAMNTTRRNAPRATKNQGYQAMNSIPLSPQIQRAAMSTRQGSVTYPTEPTTNSLTSATGVCTSCTGNTTTSNTSTTSNASNLWLWIIAIVVILLIIVVVGYLIYTYSNGGSKIKKYLYNGKEVQVKKTT